MPFELREARRENVGLVIGVAGGTGSGKTYSAMRLAKGISGDQKFAVIDTENGRAKHYADFFKFDHGTIRAPFRPDTYLEAILECDKRGYPAIVVDSFSHEHDGEGGLLDWHDEELDRLTRGDDGRRDAMNMKAWIAPKVSHKRMVQRLLQVRAHLILCFRAESKIEIGKDDKGRTVVREKKSLVGYNGWIPVAEKNLPYELTVFFMLLAEQPGIPHPIKLQEQHRPLFPLDQPITEESGAGIASWANGGSGQIDWSARIAGANTRADLAAVGRDLNRLKSTLTEAAIAIIRGEYEHRMNELPKAGAA
jgi:hypothetical protein